MPVDEFRLQLFVTAVNTIPSETKWADAKERALLPTEVKAIPNCAVPKITIAVRRSSFEWGETRSKAAAFLINREEEIRMFRDESLMCETCGWSSNCREENGGSCSGSYASYVIYSNYTSKLNEYLF